MKREPPVWKVSSVRGVEVARIDDDEFIARCCFCDSRLLANGFAFETNPGFAAFVRSHDHCGAGIHRLAYVSFAGKELGAER